MTAADDDMMDRYLDGTLGAAETTAWEARLTAEPDLRRRLEIRRFFRQSASSGELSLLDVLNRVDQEHYTAAPPSNRNRWLLGAVLLLLALLGLYYITQRSAGVPAEQSETVLPAPPADGSATQRSVTPLPPVIDTVQQTTPTPQPPPQTTPAREPLPPPNPPRAPVYAALVTKDYTPSATLDRLTSGQVRAAEGNTTFEFNQPTDTLRLANEPAVHISTTVAPPYQVVVYDNTDEAFLNDQAALRPVLDVSTTTDGYRFTVDLSPIARGGRYYLLVFDQDDNLLRGEDLLLR